MKIRLRFCRSDSLISGLIVAQEGGTVMPFVPSHVEAVVPPGLSVPEGHLGAHMDGGVKLRPAGYDRSSTLHEVFFDLNDSELHADAFYSFLISKIGQPYDWKAIVSFVDPLLNLHSPGTSICSALIALGLRGCGWFPNRLAYPAHRVSPAALLLVLSGRMSIPGV